MNRKDAEAIATFVYKMARAQGSGAVYNPNKLVTDFIAESTDPSFYITCGHPIPVELLAKPSPIRVGTTIVCKFCDEFRVVHYGVGK